MSAPDPSKSDGQYLVITRGSVVYQGNEHKAITIIFIKPDETSFQLAAGAEGLEALVLQFPKHDKAEAITSRSDAKAAGLRVWQCVLCAFIYDESKGMPDDGIAPGTRWADVPDDWICPDCAAGKAEFEMEAIA